MAGFLIDLAEYYQVVQILQELRDATLSDESGAIRYELFADHAGGNKITILEQYVEWPQ